MKRTIKVTYVFLILHSLISLQSLAQSPDKLEYEAQSLEGVKKDGEDYKKLTGNVKFTQKNTIIYCDSAFAYDKTNSMEAFGNVKIEDLEDSVTITSNKLFYDGNGKLAKLRGDVLYIDDSIRLYTDNLDYDMSNKSATYVGGGKIIDGVNTLESIHGNYDTEGKMMIFTDSVKLINPDYTMESSDLIYNIVTKKARTNSETIITTKEGRSLRSKRSSEFDTGRNTSAFLIGEVDTDKYFLKGDELFFDDNLGSYSAKGNVYLLAKEDSVIITGGEAKFWQDRGIAKVYEDPLLKKLLSGDTLYLRADTLVSIDDSLEVNKRLLAYENVKIYKTDIQGKADSIAYYLADSSISFFRDPILWNEGSQITADTIHILVKGGTIDQLQTSANSFIISKDSTNNYNQIKGRHMVAFFEGKSIRDVDVNGNGESIYFVAEEENPKVTMGMNQIICSNMKIVFKENQVNDIRFYTNPDGSFIPPHELEDDEKQLEGFAWRINERPTKKGILIKPLELQLLSDEEAAAQGAFEQSDSNEKLKKMMEENIDTDRIKEQLVEPTRELKNQK
ncbi:MAG: Organic solvent tolerance protein OstA [Cytophagales bacterium]|nr:Organic solvent tolerance protein OstA [Cytophagales bacterium]